MCGTSLAVKNLPGILAQSGGGCNPETPRDGQRGEEKGRKGGESALFDGRGNVAGPAFVLF